MSEEIITTLSNLGAIEESRAVSLNTLGSSEPLKNRVLQEEIQKLIVSGYVRCTDDKVYLTKAGLFRALSRFS